MRLWAEERNGGCGPGSGGHSVCCPERYRSPGVGFITLGQSGTTDVRIRHKVFQDCSGVENNKVEVRRFSIPG